MSDSVKKINVRLVTPERVVFSDKAIAVSAPTLLGQITILRDHIPLISILERGEILIHHEGDIRPMFISGGFIEVEQNNVTILADTAQHVHELDEVKIQEAMELAQKLLVDKKYDLKEYETLKANLNRYKAELSSFKKWRK